MSKLFKILTVGVSVIILFFGPMGATLAASGDSPVTSFDQVIIILNRILTWFATAFWIFAVGGSFYAGFLYLTASGSPERVQKAKKQMVYVVIAVIIGLLAYGVPAILRSILGGGNNPGGASNGSPGGFVLECESNADCSFDICPGTGSCNGGSCSCDPV